MSVERLRLFVAVAVPRDVRSEIDDATEAVRAGARARWTDPASWHVTLAFLGGVAAERLDELAAALRPVAARHEAITLRLTGSAGMFGRRVLWAGIEDSPPLAALHADVNAALEPLGFPPDDRPFHPHLTLARAQQDHALPRDLADRYQGPSSTWRVEHLDLMRSRLSRSGARYDRLEAWALGGGGGI